MMLDFEYYWFVARYQLSEWFLYLGVALIPDEYVRTTIDMALADVASEIVLDLEEINKDV